MKVTFKKIILHNFLSFAHSEIDLSDKSYCIVKGINNNPKDNALSNGSGKSSIWSGIVWAITGETISGLTNVKNIYIDENNCYVDLYFSIDNNDYELIRYKEPKSDLKIYQDGKEISGKGIRESEIILAKYLPDLTRELLTSVIILGQGLPDKLSAKSPSGRKELLERLSKSDFMIEDVKTRLNKRLSEISLKNQEIDNLILKCETELNFYKKELEEKQNYLLNDVDIDYTRIIDQLNEEINVSQINVENIKTSCKTLNKVLEDFSNNFSDLMQEKGTKLNEALINYNNIKENANNEKIALEQQITTLKKEISQLDNIKDICPTCGQKIPGVLKIDTSDKKEKLTLLEENYNKTKQILDNYKSDYDKKITDINKKFTDNKEILDTAINANKKELAQAEEKIKTLISYINDCKLKLVKVQADKEHKEELLKTIHSRIVELQNIIEQNNKTLEQLDNNKFNIQQHLEVLNQMNTLVKRDFRGYLLSDIIKFIDMQVKHYSSYIFGSNDLSFILNGNCIDITYCNKMYEALSGGEKQKVDLAVQFALRDMLQQYLDFSCNILVLDEIFDNLDPLGTNNVINLISNKFNDIESVFIISHHADELNIPYDSEINIIKNEYAISEVL